LKQIEGSCHIPVACFGKIINNEVVLTAVVASIDGKKLIKEQIISPMDKVESHGRTLADQVLEKGGKKILESLNSNDG
ncbi:MAG: hydroxymethylbilane synthase, partial [Desulfobacula sp.]|nr:hydroxymethylbilane synthase [Desulfobacula sp.]